MEGDPPRGLDLGVMSEDLREGCGGWGNEVLGYGMKGGRGREGWGGVGGAREARMLGHCGHG